MHYTLSYKAQNGNEYEYGMRRPLPCGVCLFWRDNRNLMISFNEYKNNIMHALHKGIHCSFFLHNEKYIRLKRKFDAPGKNIRVCLFI